MTTATKSAAPSLAALTQLVTSAAGRFPTDGLVAGPPDTQTDVAELLPAADALVLVAPIDTSPERQIVIAVVPTLLGAMGLEEADGLPTVLAPVISALADGIAVSDSEVRLGVGTIGLAGVPAAEGGELLVAAGLFLGSEHVATIGIGVAQADATEDESPVASAMDLPDVAAQPAPAAVGVPVGARSLDLLRNVEMNVTAELGRSKMTVADLLSLTPGSVVELDRAAGTPIDLLVNGTLIARGEVVVIDEEFGVRISEIVDRVEGI